MKPALMTYDQIRYLLEKCDEGQEPAEFVIAVCRTIEAVRDAQWEQLLKTANAIGEVK